MATELDPQAQAATEPAATATEAAPELPAAEPTPNLNNPAALSERDVEGLDARSYAEMMERVRNGEQVEAQALPAEPVAAPKIIEEQDTPERIRLSGFDERQQEAILLVRKAKAEGKTVSLSEAERRIAILHGDDPAQPNHEATPTEPAATPTVADMQAAHAQLLLDEEAAGNDVDTSKLVKIGREIRAMERQIAGAQAAESQSAADEKAAILAGKARLRERYPDFADPNSALSLKWKEIHDRYVAANHPLLLDQVTAMQAITLQAADELNLAPKTAKAPAKPLSSSPPPPAKTKPPVLPASGAARTIPPASTTGQLEQQIDGVKNLRDYEKLKAQLLIPA